MNTLFSEAIKLKDGVLYNLEYHQNRIDRTLRRFYGNAAIDLRVLKGTIPQDKKTGLYKCRLEYSHCIHTVEFTPYALRKITKVRIVEDNDIEYDYKYADRTRLNRLRERSGCDDIIIVKDNRLTDSYAANLVFRSESGLYTPESCLLEGTKRQYLLDRGIIRKKKICPEDIAKYDRILFINALMDPEDNIGIDTPSLL